MGRTLGAVGNDVLVVPWRKLAIGLGLVVVATLTALVVVVTVRDVEVLSTVALALAVLAFGAQLVTSLIQGQAAGDQQAQAERINTETRALLASIDASTTGLRGTVERQFDSLLTHVVNNAVPEALSSTPPGSSAEEIKEAIVSSLRSEIRGYVTPTSRSRGVDVPLNLRPGDVVEHATFGRGRVLAVEGEGDRAEATIDFADVGKKRLLISWSPLEVVVQRERHTPPERRPSLFDDDGEPADDNATTF